MKRHLSQAHKESISKGLLKHYNNGNRTGTLTKNGYTAITINRKRMYLHRLIMEKYVGYTIPPELFVHHINGNRQDNNISNLKIINKHEHSRMHALERGFGKDRVGVEPTNKTSKKMIRRIIKLRKQGKLLREICEITGISLPTVHKYSKLKEV